MEHLLIYFGTFYSLVPCDFATTALNVVKKKKKSWQAHATKRVPIALLLLHLRDKSDRKTVRFRISRRISREYNVLLLH